MLLSSPQAVPAVEYSSAVRAWVPARIAPDLALVALVGAALLFTLENGWHVAAVWRSRAVVGAGMADAEEGESLGQVRARVSAAR